ncbi:MAG: UDP-3-O-(3-hydroxymyristoyl)glucosamine N-acyltransferase [Bacteroidetes bacterium]|nr:UDP-3-O-(3-hydroxymyristoyl)glucosamine N-acyltransferase [Bacteroidota bacterium]
MTKLSVTEVAELIGGEIEGKSREWISGISKIDQGIPGSLTFLSNPKYAEHLFSTQADIILINRDQEINSESDKTFIRTDNAYLAFCQILNHYYNPARDKSGVDNRAVISSSASIGDNVYIGANAFVGDRAKIGNGVKIYPNVYIGDDAVIGDNTLVYSNVSVYHECVVGKNGIIHSGTVIGSDGFGHAPKGDGTYVKIPQIGNVVVGDDVEIGSNCSIDRATIGSTRIGDGVKLDNLIQVAHNVEIGDHTVIAGQTGISGSTTLGKYCVIGGQVGFAGHLKVADGTQVGAQSGLNKDITEKNTQLFGSPVMPVKDALRSHLMIKDLPNMRDRISKLEKLHNQSEKKEKE